LRNNKETNFGQFLSRFVLTTDIYSYFSTILNFSIDSSMKQREYILLGKMTARIVACNYALTLGNTGYNQKLIENAICNVRAEIKRFKNGIVYPSGSSIVFEYEEKSNWVNF